MGVHDGGETGPVGALVRRRYLVLVLLGLGMFVASLGLRDFWYPDEPDLAEVARAMYDSGDLVVPLRNGDVYLDYPPLLYWLGCASARLVGEFSPFALRLPSALAAIALALVTCAAASRRFGPRAGWWAGVLLLTFTQFAYNAVAFRPDALFAFWIGTGTFLYAAGREEGRGWGLRIAGFACLGLAVLTKGPLGLLLPGLVLVLWHGARREWRALLGLVPLGLVAALVALPWYAACVQELGFERVWRDVYAQNFERFDEGIRYQGHIRPAWYYFANVWADLAPFAFLLPFAVGAAWRGGARRRPDVQLALWWIFAWVVFLSIAATKRQLYLLPAYPAAAFLLAPYLAALGHGATDTPDPRPARVLTRAVEALLLCAGVLLVLGGFLVGPIAGRLDLADTERAVVHALPSRLVGLGVVSLALGWWVMDARRRRDLATVLQRTALAAALVFAVLVTLVMPALDPERSYRAPAAWIRARIGDETEIALLYPERGRNKMGAFALHTRARVVLLDGAEAVETWLDAHPRSLALVHEKAATPFLASPPARLRVLGELRAGRRTYHVVARQADEGNR